MITSKMIYFIGRKFVSCEILVKCSGMVQKITKKIFYTAIQDSTYLIEAQS